jgi:predicted patatin/cPLA2 family phospholipase
MEGIGLVLEGGGMRGLYTAGVLDFFMEKGLYFPYVIGVSAGACNGASYLSRQRERSKNINVNYVGDSRYLSIKNLLTKRSLFDMDFIFKEITEELNPFDYNTFFNTKDEFVIVTTECTTGKAVYFYKSKCKDIMTVLRASSSLPFISPIVKFQGMELLDGGIADPIPIRKSIEDGNHKNVVILTRNKGYRKREFKYRLISKIVYKNYNGLTEALIKRHKIYNETIDYIEKLESRGDVFIIRPIKELKVDRIEKNVNRLIELYEMGYEDAKKLYSDLTKWMM